MIANLTNFSPQSELYADPPSKIVKQFWRGEISPIFCIAKNWRTRLQPIRTAAEIQVKIVLEPTERIPLYQKLASKIEELYLLGTPLRTIARKLGVNRMTVVRSLQFKNRLKIKTGRQK